MRAPIVAIIGLTVLGTSLASAQMGTNSGSSGGLSAPANPTVPPSLGSGPTVQAPVGHFQPRRDSVPNENPYAESADEKALDRKIKSICRGC
jgi:hypothetical protein